MLAENRNIYILSFVLWVVMLGYGMVLPVMPFYIEMLGAGGRELGWLMSTYSLMQLICAPLWGVFSDRVGRKPVLTVGVFGYAVTLFLFGLATQFWMLFLARTLAGILSSATMPTAMAYIGDQLPEDERSGGMGQLGAAMGLGVILGPLLGGWFSAISLSLPFMIGAGLALMAALIAMVWLPEPRQAAQSQDTAHALKKPSFSRQALVQILLSPGGLLLLLVFIMSFGLTNFQGMVGLYVIDRLSFTPKQVGALWMVIGVVMIVGQGLLSGWLAKRMGPVGLICSGLLCGAIGFVFMALAVDFTTMMLALGFFMLALAWMGPALNAHISSYGGEHQGAMMGLNSAASSLGRVMGPLWGGWLYDINLAYPFWSGAATLMLGFLAAIFWLQKPKRSP